MTAGEGRKFITWEGQNLSPEHDLTEPTSDVHVIWEEVEVGGRAWKGESDLGTVPLRDERGSSGPSGSLPAGLTAVWLLAHNRWQWTEQHGSNTMARGWLGPRDYMRDLEGGLRADRYREVRMSVLDANEQLKGIIVDANRPSESDVTRVGWVRTTYLNGSPDPTRVISGTYISGSNAVTLPALRVYGDPRGVLAEIASFANKEVFVTSDEELFYDGWDSEAYAAGLRISDRLDEITVGGSGEGASSVRLYPSLVDAGSSTNAESLAAPDLGPSDKAAAWDAPHNGGIQDYDMLYDSPVGSGTSSRNSWDGVNQAAGDFCIFGFVHRLDGDLLSIIQNGGTVRGQHNSRARFGIGISEASQAQYATFCVRVYRPGTASFVATLVDVGDFVGSVRFLPASGGRNASFGPVSFSAFAGAQDGDYVVIDVGNRHVAPTSGGAGAGSAITDTAGSDLPLDDVSTDALNSWWQFGPPEESLPTYPPIWDVGPAATIDGQQVLSGLRMYYGAGSNTYVYVSNPTIVNGFGLYEESLYAPENITTAAAATTLANAVLARRSLEDRNINVSIGPLPIEHAILVKYGQLIDIKARAIPFADDQYLSGRIRQLRWTTPVPGMFFAHMQIERPLKEVPYGVGNRSGSEAVSAHVLQGSNAHPEFVLRAVLTQQGDLPYRGGSDWTRLAIGSSNTWLKSTGVQPVWASLPSTSGTVAVEDEGVEEGAAIDRFDFTGAGVSVSVSGSQATIDVPGGGAGGNGNLWMMAKSATLGDQSLTNATENLITWDTAEIDGGSSVIDLANERFVAPATGFYMAHFYWRWGGTAAGSGAYVMIEVNGTDTRLVRGSGGSHGTNQTLIGSVPLSLAANDAVTMLIDPNNTSVVAVGSNSIHIRTWFALQRIT